MCTGVQKCPYLIRGKKCTDLLLLFTCQFRLYSVSGTDEFFKSNIRPYGIGRWIKALNSKVYSRRMSKGTKFHQEN